VDPWTWVSLAGVGRGGRCGPAAGRPGLLGLLVALAGAWAGELAPSIPIGPSSRPTSWRHGGLGSETAAAARLGAEWPRVVEIAGG